MIEENGKKVYEIIATTSACSSVWSGFVMKTNVEVKKKKILADNHLRSTLTMKKKSKENWIRFEFFSLSVSLGWRNEIYDHQLRNCKQVVNPVLVSIVEIQSASKREREKSIAYQISISLCDCLWYMIKFLLSFFIYRIRLRLIFFSSAIDICTWLIK